MVKKNKILVACLALLLVLSVGYALFSETITINGTATAKGSFDISYKCEIVNTDLDGSGIYTRGGTGKCDTTGGVIKTTSTLNKPTDAVVYKVTLTNSGTIAAKLKTVATPNNISDLDALTSGDMMYYDSSTALAGYFIYVPAGGTIDEDGILSESTLESLELTINPQESLVFYVAHSLISTDKNQPALPANGATLNYNVSLGFEQVAVQ